MDHLEIRLFAEFFLFDDEEEEAEHVQRAALEKVEKYAEETVVRYTDGQFKQHFRMSRTTFRIVMDKLHSVVDDKFNRVSGNPELTLEKQMLMSMWYLANIESFRGVADRFGVSKSTAWNSLNKICHYLLKLNEHQKVISVKLENFNITTNYFRNKTGFPGIIGIIDGSHIPIKAPKNYPASYINRKGYHSVILQGVCDNKKKFIDCYTGEVGSMHDARVLRKSDFGQMLDSFEIPEDKHFLGDSAYPLRCNLLIPYKDNGHLSNIQINYNNALSKCRIFIEHCFALLKGRFRRLKLLEAQRIEIVPQIIIAACILHNICRDTEDELQINLNEILQEEMLMRPGNLVLEGRYDRRAVNKRNNIANYLYMRMNNQ